MPAVTAGRMEYPTMYGENGWYGWQGEPWSVGALEVWYWSMRLRIARASRRIRGSIFLDGKNPAIRRRLFSATWRASRRRSRWCTPTRRGPTNALADNMLDMNPAATESLVRLMFGGLIPGRDGGY
jgi:hypothetical protein